MLKVSFYNLSLLILLLLNVGCEPADEGINILDAAAIYETHPTAFRSIRETYPGPFSEFTRVPARNPADSTRENELFIKQLRKQFPVEYIDFFPPGEAGRDEIDVVLKRYGIDSRYTVVSLIYSAVPITPPVKESNIASFERCDERALEWFHMHHRAGPVSAFCRINEYWYAFQRID